MKTKKVGEILQITLEKKKLLGVNLRIFIIDGKELPIEDKPSSVRDILDRMHLYQAALIFMYLFKLITRETAVKCNGLANPRIDMLRERNPDWEAESIKALKHDLKYTIKIDDFEELNEYEIPEWMFQGIGDLLDAFPNILLMNDKLFYLTDIDRFSGTLACSTIDEFIEGKKPDRYFGEGFSTILGGDPEKEQVYLMKGWRRDRFYIHEGTRGADSVFRVMPYRFLGIRNEHIVYEKPDVAGDDYEGVVDFLSHHLSAAKEKNPHKQRQQIDQMLDRNVGTFGVKDGNLWHKICPTRDTIMVGSVKIPPVKRNDIGFVGFDVYTEKYYIKVPRDVAKAVDLEELVRYLKEHLRIFLAGMVEIDVESE